MKIFSGILAGILSLLASGDFSAADARADPTFVSNPVIQEIPEPVEATAQLALASWYGKGFNGRPTACGKVFQATDDTIVAHRSLDCGTRVKFTNPQTGQTHTAIVLDRGPCHRTEPREFDLSAAAADRLGIRHQGKGELAWEVIPGSRTWKHPKLNCARYSDAQLRYG